MSDSNHTEPEERYIILHGATMPCTVEAPSLVPISLEQGSKHGLTASTTANTAQFARVGAYREQPLLHEWPPAGVPIRPAMVSVACVCEIGTIDELVERFRQNLTEAAQRVDECIQRTSWQKYRKAQQELLDKEYPRSGEAVLLPWDWASYERYQQAAVQSN